MDSQAPAEKTPLRMTTHEFVTAMAVMAGAEDRAAQAAKATDNGELAGSGGIRGLFFVRQENTKKIMVRKLPLFVGHAKDLLDNLGVIPGGQHHTPAKFLLAHRKFRPFAAHQGDQRWFRASFLRVSCHLRIPFESRK
jgi:hypothetical protein